MKKLNKGFIVPMTIAVVTIIIVLGGIYIYTNIISSDPGEIQDITNNNDNVDTADDQSLKTYSSNRFELEFKYPKEISVSENNKEITLNHSIPYENYGCDMSGDGVSYERLNDFNVTIKVLNKSIYDSIKLESPYIQEENFINGKLVINPGYIDSYEVGSVNGYSIYIGAEGCGNTTYYLPISDLKTLVVRKDQVQELSGVLIAEVKEKVLAIPGVISSEKADEILKQILSSIKFTDETMNLDIFGRVRGQKK